MKKLDVQHWNRRQHFEFFNTFQDPFFAIAVPVEVGKAYEFAKASGHSFFAVYLQVFWFLQQKTSVLIFLDVFLPLFFDISNVFMDYYIPRITNT